MDVKERERVRMNLDAFRPGDDDDAGQLMGTFRRKAREQGWTEADIDEVCRGVTTQRVHQDLRPYIEPVGPEPLSWRTQFDRNRDYVEGGWFFAEDRSAAFNPRRFLARGFKMALRGTRR
jgi:hypothetical protein